jgi:predicted RNA-binding protein Jag
LYDPKSEHHEFFGANRDEAVAKAASYFGVSEDDLKIFELAEGDVSGLTAQALVVAIPSGAARPSRSDRGDSDDRGFDRESRGRGRDRDGGRDRGRGGDRDRGRGGDRDRGRGGDRDRDRGRGPDRDRNDDRGGRPERAERAEPAVAPAVAPAVEGPSEATKIGELSPPSEFVAGVIERLQVGSFEIEEGDDDDLCVIQIRGAAAQNMTGGDGRAVDAIQLLANQAALRVEDDAPRVVLDVDGDREQRESYLEDLAQRAARRALKISRPVALDPMNGRERRVLHVALRDSDEVATMSTGEGRYRQVVVVPKGAPEYEEARRSSEEAASRED